MAHLPLNRRHFPTKSHGPVTDFRGAVMRTRQYHATLQFYPLPHLLVSHAQTDLSLIIVLWADGALIPLLLLHWVRAKLFTDRQVPSFIPSLAEWRLFVCSKAARPSAVLLPHITVTVASSLQKASLHPWGFYGNSMFCLAICRYVD